MLTCCRATSSCRPVPCSQRKSPPQPSKNLFHHHLNSMFLRPGPNPMLFTTRCSYAFSRSLPTSAANPMFLIVPLDANMMMVYVVAAVAAISELCLFILTARSLSALALLAWLITWIHDCSYETTGFTSRLPGNNSRSNNYPVGSSLCIHHRIGGSHRLIGCCRGRFPRFDHPSCSARIANNIDEILQSPSRIQQQV